MQETKKTKRGRPKNTDAKPRFVIQLRYSEEGMKRLEQAKESIGVHNRSEMARILIDEALKARGH